MISHGKAFFYPSVSTFMIASGGRRRKSTFSFSGRWYAEIRKMVQDMEQKEFMELAVGAADIIVSPLSTIPIMPASYNSGGDSTG